MRTAAKTAFLLAILTLGSKVIGFVREILMANYYGASYVVDAYTVSQSIPTMIFAGVLGAVATAFMPLFSKKNEEEGEIQANLFTSQTINILFIISAISSLVGILFSDQLVMIFASGFEGETANLASFYVKVTFSFTLFSTVGNIMDAYLKYKGSFLSQTVASYSISGFTLLFIVISHYTSPYVMIFGLLVGNAVRAIAIWILAKGKGYKHKFNFKVTNTVKQIFILALPVFFGTTVGQIKLFINKTLATRLPEGSASAINYSDLLVQLIVGITATIIATILYPKMSQAFANKDFPRYTTLYNSGISIILMITLPICLGALVYSYDIIQVIYERGAFDSAATDLTYKAFFYYSLGLIFASLNGFQVQTFYSMHNTKTPLINSVITVIIGIVASLILVNFMAHSGLALSTTISWTVNSILLLWGIQTKTDIKLDKALPKKLGKLFIASVISVGISWIFNYFVGGAIWMPRMLLLFLTICIAVGVYLILLKVFKVEELVHIKEIFRIPQQKPITDEPPDTDPDNEL